MGEAAQRGKRQRRYWERKKERERPTKKKKSNVTIVGGLPLFDFRHTINLH